MKFNDILKKSFVNTFAVADLSLSETILIFAITLIFALYIYFIYRIFARKKFL